RCPDSSALVCLRNPITAAGGCCARVASGQAADEPAITILMKSRRRTQPSPARLRTTPVFEAYQIRAALSALGQKQTFAVQKGMSALPPKADIDVARHGAAGRRKKRRSRPLITLNRKSVEHTGPLVVGWLRAALVLGGRFRLCPFC